MSEFKRLALTAPAFASSFFRSSDRSGQFLNGRAMLYPISTRTIAESALCYRADIRTCQPNGLLNA